MKQGKQKALAQFVRMPDGSVKVVSVEEVHKKEANIAKKAKKKLKLPKIKLSKVKQKSQKVSRLNRKQLFFVLPIIAALIGLGVLFINRQNKPQSPATKVLGQNVSQKPDFKWILPRGSVDKIAGGQVNYDPQKKVVLYTDIINGTTVGVTQQALPSTFKDNVKEKMAEYAKKINCTSQIEVGDVMAYAGLSTKGPQTVVFAKNNLLVSIVADKEIDPQSWGSYINSLK